MQFIAGTVLSIVFQLAHSVVEAEFPLPNDENIIENEWAIHQMNTTVNFARNNKIISWYVGGLNFQVEHHLFPNICHVHYPEISKIVEETAKEFGVPYLDTPTLGKAVASHLQMLKRFGYTPELDLARM
jgi:linoleoyl-CoA desaturase